MLNHSQINKRFSDASGSNGSLSEQSLDFLEQLWLEEPITFNTLLDALQLLCNKSVRGLSLQAWHLDIVIASWQALQALPVDGFAYLDLYLSQQTESAENKPMIHTVVNKLRAEHQSNLTTQAELYHLQHHTAYHALEIKNRTLFLMMDKLHLFDKDNPRDVFLCNLISFMIEFHDYEQKERQQFACVEQVTACQVANWFIQALNLEQDAPELIPLIKLCADWVIVLGTTMIWGATSSMDLIELFLLFNGIICQSRTKNNQITEQSVGTLLSIVALLTGLCDKNPATSLALMEHEARLATIAINQSNVTPRPSIVEQFLINHLTPYFLENAIEATNKQAWRTTWAPHFHMRLELSLSDSHLRSQAIQISQLLKAYQKHLITGMDVISPSIWLNNECPHLQSLIESLFFNNRQSTNTSGLTGEKNFSLSQTTSVRFACETLPSLLQIWDKRNIESTTQALKIEPNVPAIDAKNITTLERFYNQCTDDEKKQLCHELFLTAADQMGITYSLQNTAPEQPAHRTTSENLQPSSCYKSVMHLLSNIWYCRSQASVRPEPSITKGHSTTVTLSTR